MTQFIDACATLPPPEAGKLGAPPVPATELDARGPTPPQPVPAILNALCAIPAGHPQFVRTSSAPTGLVRALRQHGVLALSAPLPDGTWRTLVLTPTAETS